MEQAAKQPYQQLAEKLVLSVDDNELNQLLISKILEKAGIQIITAYNGANALEQIQNGLKPDVILMDLQMPGMDGVQTSEIIKHDIDPEMPIVINSGLVSNQQKEQLQNLGISEFLEKPYTQADIFTKLMNAIHLPAQQFRH